MKIHNKTVMIYDIEIFPNVFHCVLKDTDTNEIHKIEISERLNQLDDIVNIFTDKNLIFCGYNNKHYDNIIINYIIDCYYIMNKKDIYTITKSLYNLSQILVNHSDNIETYKRWKYANYFESIDLLTMMFSSKLRVGLKSMQITMQYNNVYEYGGDFEQWLNKDKIDEMIGYNINDVESTYTLFQHLVKKGEIDLRLFIEKEYGFNALSMDSVKFGETLLAKKVCEELHINKKQLEQMRSPMDNIPLKDVILPFIKYKNPKFQEVLEDMKKQVVSSKNKKPGEKNYENRFVVSNIRYSVGVGGIHSLNEPQIYVPKEDEYLGHLDVASMYPSFIVRYGWFPRHLGKAGLDVYTHIYHERIQAKHSGQKLKNLALKLVLNSVTGKMQQETSWMYDPFSVFKIRINGQLILLMLVDILLQHSCKIVQVNTDGVMFIAKKSYRDAIMESVAQLEQLTKLSFEADSYEAFYQFAVNDYFGVVDGFSQSRDPKLIEKKGMFITEPVLGKGLSPTIIPQAVINYFVNHIPVEDTIKQCTDIRKFLMSQRVDKKFKVEYQDKFIQRINRWYASTNGYYLYTVNTAKNPWGYSNLLKKSGVTILNKLDDIPIKDRKINYPYYISEARKIVNQLECRQLDLFQSC